MNDPRKKCQTCGGRRDCPYCQGSGCKFCRQMGKCLECGGTGERKSRGWFKGGIFK